MAPQGGKHGGNIKAKRGKEVMHIKRNVDTKVVTTLVGLVILSGCILSNIGTSNSIIGNSNNASATSDGSSSTTNVSVTVSDACTMSVSGNQGTLGEDGNYTYSATIQGGTNGEIIANSIKTFCNDFSGFSIYAIGYSNDTLGDTDLVYNNTTTNDYNIKTDATGTYNSYWQMKLANNTTTNVTTTIPTTYQDYNVIPNDYTLVAQYNSNTGNTDATSSIITPSYKVYIASAQPAGTYTGKVKYTLVHPMNAAKPEMPCDGIKANSICYTDMQDFTDNATAIKNAMIEEQQYQLKDSRDNKLYWVSKLKDGNVWMTQNLDYDIKASGNEVAVIGGTTTTWNSTYPAYATETTLSGHYSNTDTYSWDPGDYYVENGGGSSECSTWRPTSDCESTKATVSLTSADAKDNTNLHYHLGNYYQWNTATAGYGGTEKSKDINYSICPKGWRLPTSNSYTNNYSFGKLTNAYGITNSANGSSDANLLSSPLWFVRAGYINGSSLINQGKCEGVWSSRAYSDSYLAYRLYFYSTGVLPSSYNTNRSIGNSVRCVAE